MKSLYEYITETQKTWKDEIIDIAKQFIIEPNRHDYERSDIEKMINDKKIKFDLSAALSEYLAYAVTNRHGDMHSVDEIASKFRSKTKKEAYLKLHDYDEKSNNPEDKEITELIITGLQKGLKINKDF